MTDASERGATEPPDRNEPPTPKRGAFPTPKSEIEAAEQFVPDPNEVDERREATTDPSTDADNDEHA